jgi:uncharacterized DUF497 family protein
LEEGEVSDYGWDQNKQEQNKEKHKTSFEEAVEVLKESPLIYFGEDLSETYSERRYCAAGFTKKEKFIFVVFEEIEDSIGKFTQIIHAKYFEKSHLKHFGNPNDKREIQAILQHSPSSVTRQRKKKESRKAKKGY